MTICNKIESFSFCHAILPRCVIRPRTRILQVYLSGFTDTSFNACISDRILKLSAAVFPSEQIYKKHIFQKISFFKSYFCDFLNLCTTNSYIHQGVECNGSRVEATRNHLIKQLACR